MVKSRSKIAKLKILTALEIIKTDPKLTKFSKKEIFKIFPKIMTSKKKMKCNKKDAFPNSAIPVISIMINVKVSKGLIPRLKCCKILTLIAMIMIPNEAIINLLDEYLSITWRCLPEQK